MDARAAFEKFEKRGAGVWPVLVLSLLAFVATMLVVQMAKRLKSMDNAASHFIAAGFNIARTLGFDTELAPLDEPSAELHSGVIAKERTELDEAIPENLKYCGLFQSTGLDELWHQTWLDAGGRYQVEILRPQQREDGSYYPILISSQTEGDEWLFTSSEQMYLQAPSWQKLNAFESKMDPLKVYLPKMLAEHQLFVGDQKLKLITQDNYVPLNEGRKRREMLWLIEQAPLPIHFMEKLMLAKRPEATKDETAQVLIGFCWGLCKSYDMVAIESFRDQFPDKASQTENVDEMVVLHDVTNQVHIAHRLLGSKTQFDELSLEWTQELLRDGRTNPQAVEAYLEKLTRPAPLIKIGELQKPFPAKIYRIPTDALATHR